MSARFATLPVLLVALGGCATAERQARYDEAMRLTVAELREGDLAGARTSVDVAFENACDDEGRRKAEDLSHLIEGAEVYCQGDRIAASEAWSETESPVIRRAIAANESELGIDLRSEKGGRR